jgi:steroid delta-isomerase-like uncharacterized protein
MNSTDANGRLLRSFIEQVWNRGDADAAGDFIAPLYTVRHDPGDPWHGRELDLAEFQERVRAGRAPFPDQRFVIRELLADGHKAFLSWTWTGTHLVAIGDFAATGKVVSTSGLTLYDFEAGRLRGHWQVVDRLSVFQQLMRNRQG